MSVKFVVPEADARNFLCAFISSSKKYKPVGNSSPITPDSRRLNNLICGLSILAHRACGSSGNLAERAICVLLM